MIQELLRIVSTPLSSKADSTMDGTQIRRATLGDARQIADIYNHYIAHSTATFDTQPKAVGERIAWLTEHGDLHPVFVSEADGEVVAWGSLTPFRDRPAYRHTVEVAVYVAPNCTGMGLGPKLLERLVDAARGAGHHVVVSQIVSENLPSLKLAERAGFTEVGTMHEVGRKFDRWLDVVIMELSL